MLPLGCREAVFGADRAKPNQSANKDEGENNMANMHRTRAVR